jgi:general secretion pathway protein E/type IV pilus assembly protein PilB
MRSADGKTQIDLRVSTIPTNHGESIVMRILDKTSLQLGLTELGYLTDDQATMERIMAFADGIFLVTGPTGSGKSTTLYACLNMINKPDRKIITVEDPVEYQLAGINQVPVNAEVGMTFPAALRAMLRQAPNIIMVGEIRDLETAAIAINASLTGHLVFSTLHTNDAPSAITRIIDIGVKKFLVASSVRAIMAQRLVRRICKECTDVYEPTEKELESLNITSEQMGEANFRKGRGCDRCRGTGYKGRMGIFEIFVLDDEIRRMVNEGLGVSAIRQRARDLGMRTLREDGIRKVLAGMTTPEEVISATMGDKE